MHWGYDPPSATPHIQLVTMQSPKAKEEIQNNSLKFSKMGYGYPLCPFFARTNWNKHSSLQLSTSAERSAQLEPAYVSGKADNDAICSSTSFCACTSKFSAPNQWPYSLVYLAPWLNIDFSLRYKCSAAQTSRFHQLTWKPLTWKSLYWDTWMWFMFWKQNLIWSTVLFHMYINREKECENVFLKTMQ